MTCSDCMAHVGSAEFIDRLVSLPRKADELPLAGSFELTFRCNFNCRHCYAHYPGCPADEMSTGDVQRVLDKIAEHGALLLLLTGGEIFVRKDFRDIYLHAKRLGLLLTLYTNATLIDEPMADLLAEYPPRHIEISVYGHTAETYERVTGVRGSHARFDAGVSRLLDRKLPVRFKTIVLKSNQHEFNDILRWADTFGYSLRYDAIVNPRLDGNMEPALERIDAQSFAELYPHGEEEIGKLAELRGAARQAPPDDRLFKCGAGRMAFHVDPQGRIHACMMWRKSPYDFLTGSVEGWNRQMRDLSLGKAPAQSACTTCVDRLTCASCAPTSLLETGEAGMDVPYYCRLCEARDKELDIRSFELKRHVPA